MGDKIISVNLHDDQETEEVETLSFTDFPVTQDHDIPTFQTHRNPPSSTAGDDFFEFSQGGLSDYSKETMMSHAEDIIFCGKLVPINEQRHRQKPPPQSENDRRKIQQNNQHIRCRRSRSEPMSGVKTTTASPLVRNSRSLDYKKLNMDSSMSSELPVPEISRDASGQKSSTSRRNVLLFGLVNVPPPEMDIREIKSRQVRRTASKTLFASSESSDVFPDNRSVDHRKCSWRVLAILSCKSSSSAAVATPLPYVPKV